MSKDPIAGPTDRDAFDARSGVWLVVAAWVASRGFLLLSFEPAISDVSFYWYTAERAVCHDEVPYSSGFSIGYPPLAWALMLGPRWIDNTPWDPDPDMTALRLGRYERRFRAQMFVFDLAAFSLLLLALARARPSAVTIGAGAYTLVTLILGHLLYDRLDVALLFFLMAWTYCWIRAADADREGDEMAGSWSQLSYVILGLSVSLKLLPLVALPLLMTGEWVVRRSIGGWLTALGCWGVGALFPFLLHVPTTGLGSFGFLTRHAGRGVQVESIYASVLFCLKPLGLDVAVEQTTNAWHVTGTGVPIVHRIAVVIAIAWGLGWAGLVWRRGSQAGLRWVGMVASVCIAGLPVLSHVISPQYLTWALVLLIWPAAELLPRGRFVAIVSLSIVSALLTTWLFPYHYFSQGEDGSTPGGWGLIPTLDWQACAVLAVRNLFLPGLIAWMSVVVWRAGSRSPQTSAGSLPVVA